RRHTRLVSDWSSDVCSSDLPISRWQFITRPGTFDNPALDQAAGLISGNTPGGLALIAMPPLYRRVRQTRRAAAGTPHTKTPPGPHRRSGVSGRRRRVSGGDE